MQQRLSEDSKRESGKCESEKCGVCRVGFLTFAFIV